MKKAYIQTETEICRESALDQVESLGTVLLRWLESKDFAPLPGETLPPIEQATSEPTAIQESKLLTV